MTHAVTGATGFVGSAVVLELLARTDQPIVGIVRPNEGLTPTERLHGVLLPLVEGYGLPATTADAIKARVTAVPGDITSPACGVSEPASLAGADFWHCAASLQYQDRHRKVIERSNVGGTANALDLASITRCRRFNMISTAYVAGSRSGVIAPIPGDPRLVNNLYERSKLTAENLVRASGLDWRILRPGVVIGHAETSHTISSDGLYGFLRSLGKFRRVLERTQPGLVDRLQVRIVANGDGLLDLVPVDHVAADAVGLHLADAPEGHYHLTNPTPPTIGDTLGTAFDRAGMQQPILVEDTSELTSVDAKLHDRIDFYSSYIVNPKFFDRTSVTDVLGDEAHRGIELGRDELARFCDRYLDIFEGARSALPAAR